MSQATITSPNLAQRALETIAGGVNSGQRRIPGLEELTVKSASGATFTTGADRTFVDYHLAYGPIVLGHCDADVDAAVAHTQRTIDLTGIGVSEPEVLLAERLVSLIPSAERVLLLSTGTEATFHAVRLSRGVTGRRRLIKFQGCFHGGHDSVAMNVISAPEKVGRSDPLSTGILQEVLDATTVLPFNDITAVEEVFAARGGEIAAVILEPIAHNIGSVPATPEFLQVLRRLTSRHGSVLIFDEIITGFRHALGGYQSIVGVTPDLSTFGKAMANGYPIAALVGRAELMSYFSTTPGAPVFFAGTYNGHPAMAAAALATIDKLEREQAHEHLYRLGARAREGLDRIYRDLEIPAVVSGFGSIFVSYFLEGEVASYDDLLRNNAAMFTGVRYELMNHGVFELPLNLKRSHVTLSHSEADVDHLIDATATAAAVVVDRLRLPS